MSISWAYLKRVLAGAIFGLYMAHLLYFINPQVEITLGRLATVTVVYGLTCGLLFGSALWLLRVLRVRLFGRSEEYRTHGFGFVVFAAFISATIYWVHLKFVRIYLPIAAVRILSKATNVITVTAFVLLALWVVERSADRRTSRVIFVTGVVLIVISSFFLYQRRESYRVERRKVVVATIGGVAGHRRVVLVAIRNLPFDWIVTMNGEGLLPFFGEAVQRAYFTRLQPFPTASTKSLWASLATGKLPYRHGVTGRYSYRTPLNRSDPFLMLPSGVGFGAWGLIPPVERISAPLPAGNALPLWSLFERLHLRASVVGWPSSHAGGAARVVTDADLAKNANAASLPSAEVQRFSETGPARRTIVDALARDTAAARQVEAESGYDIEVLALEGFMDAQKALHVFSNELPPKSTRKGDVVRAYAREIDVLVGEIARARPDDLIVVCSPSAVVTPELPSTLYALAERALSREDPGADDGFLLVAGPGTTHRENPSAAFVADVVPTVLFAAGLPIGRDMDGRIVTDAFTDEMLRRRSVTAIQTYEAERVVVRRAGR